MSNSLPQSLVLIGAGKMGGAMLEGWLRIGIDPAHISLIDPTPSDDIVALAEKTGMWLNPSPADIPAPNVVVLATKPQMLDTAAPAVQAFIHPGTLLISVLAGKTLDDLAARLPDAHAIIRTMPNLPAAVQRGATAAALEVLMADDGMKPLMRKAVAAAKRRAGELSG